MLPEWFQLDTGFNGSLHLTRDFWEKNGLSGSMDRLGRSSTGGLGQSVVKGEFFKLPGLVLGNVEMREIRINVETEPTGNPQSTGLLGMEILKRFNTLLDYRKNVIYLKPNSLIKTPFRQPSDWIFAVILAGAALPLTGAAVILARRWSRRKVARGSTSLE